MRRSTSKRLDRGHAIAKTRQNRDKMASPSIRRWGGTEGLGAYQLRPFAQSGYSLAAVGGRRYPSPRRGPSRERLPLMGEMHYSQYLLPAVSEFLQPLSSFHKPQTLLPSNYGSLYFTYYYVMPSIPRSY